MSEQAHLTDVAHDRAAEALRVSAGPRLRPCGEQESESRSAERRLRIATLNLLEDALQARRREELQALERLRSDEALRDSEMRLRIALDVAGMGTFVWHLREDRSDADDRMLALCGLPEALRHEFAAAFAQLLHAEDRARYHDAVARAVRSEEHVELCEDVRIVRPDGSLRWLAINGRVYFSGDRRRAERMVVVVADVGGRKEIEQTLREAASEAERARAAALAATRAKDQFIAVLSHELRTPLTPVLMATAALTRRRDLPDPVRDALAMIRRNVELEAHLVNDLLDVTRIERGKLELNRVPMPLHGAIEAAIEISRPDIEAKQQRLAVHLQAREQRVLGDRERLEQAVWNLLKNASKFTPRQGEIRIETYDAEGSVMLRISDTGIGIEPQSMHLIFEPFVQSDRSITRAYGGLGLGLAIAKASICGHGGDIQALSAGPGLGSTFLVRLPVESR
jgi:signal transduction histidine kinase